MGETFQGIVDDPIGWLRTAWPYIVSIVLYVVLTDTPKGWGDWIIKTVRDRLAGKSANADEIAAIKAEQEKIRIALQTISDRLTPKA